MMFYGVFHFSNCTNTSPPPLACKHICINYILMCSCVEKLQIKFDEILQGVFCTAGAPAVITV